MARPACEPLDLGHQAESWGQTLVFVATQRSAHNLAAKLRKAGLSAGALHGGLDQPERIEVLDRFKRGGISFLVATDLAARGSGRGGVLELEPRQSGGAVHSADPMGTTPGRILLNGNAESIERFVRLAHLGLGPSRHRDPRVRERDGVLICAAAWGPGETHDAPIRRHFADVGRGRGGEAIDNLELFSAQHQVLAARTAVQALYADHEAVWWELFHANAAENGATVAQLRGTWGRASERFTEVTLPQLLTQAERRPGPRTRPAATLLRVGFARSLQRAMATLRDGDARRAETLRELWRHFHVAAGIEFDPLWQQLRATLVNKILGTSAVVMPGGSPTRLLAALRFFQLENVLSEALRRGTSFFGSSAGAMVLGRRVAIFNDRAEPRQEFQLLDNGVHLIEGLQVFPHCTDRVQTDDAANLAYLAARFGERRCVGLNQGSVLQLVPHRGGWRARSVGDEDVVVFGPDGTKNRYPPDSAVDALH